MPPPLEVWQQRRHAILGLFDADMAGFRHHRRTRGDQFIAIGIVLKKNAVFIAVVAIISVSRSIRFGAVIFRAVKRHGTTLAKTIVRHFHKPRHRHLKTGADQPNHVDARLCRSLLPAGKRLLGDEQLVRELRLRKTSLLAHDFDNLTDRHDYLPTSENDSRVSLCAC